jgi:Tfp pilus assembly protein FimT
MVTLAAAIILLSVGLPFFGGIVANNRAVAEANGFLASFRLARSEAVKRASYVAVAPTSVSAWNDGWFVYEESDRPGDAGYGTRQGGEPKLRQWPSVDAAVSAGAATFVGFSPTGEASSAVDFAVVPSDSSALKAHCLQVGLSGQIRMQSYLPGQGETCP